MGTRVPTARAPRRGERPSSPVGLVPSRTMVRTEDGVGPASPVVPVELDPIQTVVLGPSGPTDMV